MDEKEMLNALIGGSFEKGIRINALVEILTEKGILTKEEYEVVYERNMQKVQQEINEQFVNSIKI
ncbi:hypothetical protein QN089_09170 [Kurthia sp. YJT4]|uniref:hypothetical protein n=1 Tax=Kurthia sp. YJT4 TaxID=3049086 RepID=UPI0025515BCC|nr:hypothetical protein [Kurthia sp. YJT4]WIL37526.1 hypothetical protein QN089_09170 [Kurthia sp. YJT4]